MQQTRAGAMPESFRKLAFAGLKSQMSGGSEP
jgi:hypothetical protein